MSEPDEMDDTERYTRLGVGIAHGLGTTIFTAFGAGSIAQPLGDLENMALDAGFKSKKINPKGRVNDKIRNKDNGVSQEIAVNKNTEVKQQPAFDMTTLTGNTSNA